MSSREKILSAIRQNRPATSPLPVVPLFQWRVPSLLDAFSEKILAAHGKIALGGDIESAIHEHYPGVSIIASPLEAVNATTPLNAQAPHELAPVDLAVIRAQWGVAENGAMWVTEEAMGVRALPFIAQHLMIILHKKNIVGTMHEAYERIGKDKFGFGVFISGPSKTADIEQILVMGAHGPKTLTVVLEDESSKY